MITEANPTYPIDGVPMTAGQLSLACILQDASGIDLAEFAFVDDSNDETGCYRVRPYQWRWWRCPDPRQIDACGRALALDTPVITPTGPRPIGDLDVADPIVDPAGEVYSVVNAWDVMHDRPCRRITFAGGHSFVADADHLWPVEGPTWIGVATTDQLAERLCLGTWMIGDHIVVSIDEVPSVPVRCIEVDSPSSCFLIGDEQVPTHNSVGKSERIKARVAAFSFIHPGQEMVLVAPQAKHLDAITQRIEPTFAQCRILREQLLGASTSNGVTHRPFVMVFQNGARFYTRLPGHDGSGVKGIHPVILEVDEGQDINERTWKEMPETVRWELHGAMMLVHGVTKGVRDTFHTLTYSGKWTRHQFTAIHRDDWGPAEKARQLELYNGSDQDPDYRRNVLGEPGNAANRIFVLDWLEASRDDNPTSTYNTHEYFKRLISEEILLDALDQTGRGAGLLEGSEAQIAGLLDLCRFPDEHLTLYPDGVFWAGMDVGLVGDPSEILVFVEHTPTAAEWKADDARGLAVPKKGQSMFRLLTRIALTKIPNPLQVELIMELIDHYQPRAFSIDATGLGLPLYQDLQQRAGQSRYVAVAPPPDATDEERIAFFAEQARARRTTPVIKPYNYKRNILIGFNETRLAELGDDLPLADMIKEAGLYQNVKDRATEMVRQLVHNRRVRLPDDDEIINQWNGQQWSSSLEPMDAWGNRRNVYTSGVFHLLDAGRMFALGRTQEDIERYVRQAEAAERKPRGPVYDYL